MPVTEGQGDLRSSATARPYPSSAHIRLVRPVSPIRRPITGEDGREQGVFSLHSNGLRGLLPMTPHPRPAPQPAGDRLAPCDRSTDSTVRHVPPFLFSVIPVARCERPATAFHEDAGESSPAKAGVGRSQALIAVSVLPRTRAQPSRLSSPTLRSVCRCISVYVLSIRLFHFSRFPIPDYSLLYLPRIGSATGPIPGSRLPIPRPRYRLPIHLPIIPCSAYHESVIGNRGIFRVLP